MAAKRGRASGGACGGLPVLLLAEVE